MDMGLGMTIVMVAMMAVMVGGMVWGAVSAMGSKWRRDRTNRPRHGMP
jgi:hypothetical protein